MLFQLIKKDFMIIKKYVLYVLVFTVAIPPFLLWRAPEIPSSRGFIVSVFFSVFMLLQHVFMKEYQYPKASALLCATPYPRRKLVQSKYGFSLILYLFYCVIYWIETLLIPGLGKFNLEFIFMVFFCISMFISIFLPIHFKFGYEKSKFLFAIIIMFSPFLIPQLAKLDSSVTFNFISSIPAMLLNSMIVFVSTVILIISILISTKIYDEIDLA